MRALPCGRLGALDLDKVIPTWLLSALRAAGPEGSQGRWTEWRVNCTSIQPVDFATGGVFPRRKR